MLALVGAVAVTAWPARRTLIRSRPGVTVVEDLAYGPEAKQRLDLWLPAKPAGAKVAVFVHGGYWDAQDRRLLQPLTGLYGNVGAALAERGVATAVISYRQHPLVGGAGGLGDVAVAVSAAAREASARGADGGSVLLVGHSAGGQLAALLALDPSRLGPGAPRVRAAGGGGAPGAPAGRRAGGAPGPPPGGGAGSPPPPAHGLHDPSSHILRSGKL